jgi:hypothetical protein
VSWPGPPGDGDDDRWGQAGAGTGARRVVVEPHRLNAEPDALLLDRDGRALSALVLETLDGRVQTIRSVVNPGDLGHLGAADARTLRRKAPEVRSDVGSDAKG